MNTACTGGKLCIVFPKNSQVLYQPTSSLPASPSAVNTNNLFTISGMNNGWYKII